MGIPKEAFVVLINENPHENVGVGGVLLADRGKVAKMRLRRSLKEADVEERRPKIS